VASPVVVVILIDVLAPGTAVTVEAGGFVDHRSPQVELMRTDHRGNRADGAEVPLSAQKLASGWRGPFGSAVEAPVPLLGV
jgi:hypothetical protein